MATSSTPPLAVNCGRLGKNRFGAIVGRGQSVSCVSFCIRCCSCRYTRNSPVSNFEEKKVLVGRISAKTWKKTAEQRYQTLHDAPGFREGFNWAQPVADEGEAQLSTAVEQSRLADLVDSACIFEANIFENYGWKRLKGALAIDEERLKASNAHGPDRAVLFPDTLRAHSSSFKFCIGLQNVAHDDDFRDPSAIVAKNNPRDSSWMTAEKSEKVIQDRMMLTKVVGARDQMFSSMEIEVKCKPCEDYNRSTELNNCSSHGHYHRSDSTMEVLTGFWTGPEAEDGWGYVNAYVSPAEGSTLSTDSRTI